MAKYFMIKNVGGSFSPASELEAERLKRFKNGEIYPLELKIPRNGAFHGKVLSFFTFCFEYWSGENTDYRYMNYEAQFEEFRKDLTMKAGYVEQVYSIARQEIVTRAKSISYEKMEQQEFEQLYSALINAALAEIFNNTTDENIINRLYSFF